VAQQPARARVLVVDDDPAVAEMVVEYLVTRGYQVQASPEGRLALDLLTHTSFDVVLTDFHLPHEEGSAVLEAARQRQPPVPCVVMTGLATTTSVVSAFKAGAFDYLVKPFRLTDLHDALQDAIDRSRKMRLDALLESLVTLYDVAAMVRDRSGLRILAGQVACLALDMAAAVDACVILEDPDGGWEVLAPPDDPHRKEQPGILVALDARALVAAMPQGDVLFTEEPSRFLHDLEDHDVESGVGWLAARLVAVEGPEGTPAPVGAVVIAGEPAESVTIDAILQPLARLALVLGQAVVRVRYTATVRVP